MVTVTGKIVEHFRRVLEPSFPEKSSATMVLIVSSGIF
jgi:hypothetical protein